jgi:phytoene synthase
MPALFPLTGLLAAYGGAEGARHRLVWAFDARLAQLVRSTSEPMIGQIRLAWWQEALSDPIGVKGRGEPLVDAMRAAGMTSLPGLTAMIDGWEGMLGEIDLDLFARGRGGGLFQALAGEGSVPDWLIDAGRVWALWDLSGHVSDPALATRAVALARESLIDAPPWLRGWRAMRIAYGLARHDVIRGRSAPSGLTPALYMRLLRIALVGR